MGSPFDDQPGAEPLPFAERRHLEELASQRRQTYLLIALAIALPVLAAMVLVVCLVLPMMRGLSRSQFPRIEQTASAVHVEDRETHRERRQREAEERAEEELRAIRQRIDRGIESKQREAQRRERGLPPRLTDREDEEN